MIAVCPSRPGRVSPRRARHFSLLRQRKVPKRKATRSLGPCAALRATCAARLRRGSAELACGSDNCGPDPASICAARPSQDGLGAKEIGIGELNAQSAFSGVWLFVFFPTPFCLRRGAEVQTDQGSRLSERSEFERDPGWTEHRRVPVAQRRVADSRVAFLLLTFLWRSKEK